MNIFLDTTHTHSDPFLRENHIRLLLKLAREYKDITFYMSDVVYKETKRHFINKINKHFQQIYNAEEVLQGFKPEGFIDREKNSINQRLAEEYAELLKQFELVYEKLKEEGVLHILSCPNDFLGELIDRAVNRIKPFKEGKSEFRDAVTWLTYSNYIEQNNLSDCYFISNNTNDFLDDKKEKLHPDLMKDIKETANLKFFEKIEYVTQEEKIKKYIEVKQEREQELKDWIAQNNIDKKYVLGYFDRESHTGLYNQIEQFSEDYIINEYIEVNGINTNLYNSFGLNIDIKEIDNFNIEIIAEEIIISGKLILDTSLINVYLDGSGKHFHPMKYLLPFSFTMETNPKSMINLQLKYDELVNKYPLLSNFIFEKGFYGA
ncbi:hypothetical protein UP17_25335 (plasmid) [Peribacillus simplex]|uniref:PIN domain-containing protein n=1 Tax=Peribacillus simplex TaxID=1478 RepID=UPI0007776CB9|nr:PIN domain-containing protein [Peribacillus simplex]AMM95764.1 hypothetical protein UP17_25335 [Peribacillus simplex]